MKRLIFFILLALPLQAQKPAPFSQSWSLNSTGPYTAKDSIVPGAIVAVFFNLYTHKAGWKYPELGAVLLTFAAELLFEGYQWASGNTPYLQNALYAALGAAPVSITWKIRF